MATLYETDFHAWTQEQAGKLRALIVERANLDLDLENIAEEIESVGASDRRELHSRLARIIEHLLKLEDSTLGEPRHGWRSSVRAERASLDQLFDQSPSLRRWAEGDIVKAYDHAMRRLKPQLIELAMDPLPVICPYDISEILTSEWWPRQRDSLA